jgi:hypothetical protein
MIMGANALMKFAPSSILPRKARFELQWKANVACGRGVVKCWASSRRSFGYGGTAGVTKLLVGGAVSCSAAGR